MAEVEGFPNGQVQSIDLPPARFIKAEECPHCHSPVPTLPAFLQLQTSNSEGASAGFWCVAACTRCGGIVVAKVSVGKGSRGQLLPEFTTYPSPTEISGELPDDARRFLRQAVGSLRHPDASAVMSASAVDGMLKAKGLTTGSLNDRIKAAEAQHLITADMALWAHDVRLEANSVRHSDRPNGLTFDDAARVLDFARALGDLLFVLPARVARSKGIPLPPQGPP